MGVEAIDRRLSFKMFVKGLGQKLQGVLAKSLPPEEKLKVILEEMEKDVSSKRVTAREIRARMVALSDPTTETLEPMERLRIRKEKLVSIGAKVLKEKELAEASGESDKVVELSTQLGQLTQEVRAVKVSLSSIESTYQTLKEAYEVALENYKVGLAAYEHAKDNGPSLLMAIKAHQDALQVRDQARRPPKAVDASFLNDLSTELGKAQQELRSDQQLDQELDATNSTAYSAFSEADGQSVDEEIMKEFREKV